MPTSAIEDIRRPLLMGGFTLLELMVALTVMSLLSVLALPSMERLSDNMRYREAVRDLVSAAKTGRRDAFAKGVPYDLLLFEDTPAWVLVPAHRAADVLSGKIETHSLPEELALDVTYAAEVSPGRGIASIRFYPGGGASGGDVDVLRPSGSGVRLKIDWLLGDVTQLPVAL